MTPQSEMKPEPCPFCGKRPSGSKSFVYCNNKDCVLYARSFEIINWQTRSSGGQGLVVMTKEQEDRYCDFLFALGEVKYKDDDLLKEYETFVKPLISAYNAGSGAVEK